MQQVKYRTKYELTAWCYDKKGNLLSEAKNSYRKTHPLQAYFAEKVGLPDKIYLHAEIAAILRAGKKKIHRLVVMRYSKLTGDALPSKPCPICQEAIKAYGIKEVLYTNGE